MTSKKSGWIGVDLDGTLVEYHEWAKWNSFGPPVPRMVARVRRWLAEGREVRIFTARVSGEGEQTCRNSGEKFDSVLMAFAVQEHLDSVCGLPRLAVTCVKDVHMVELWDDRVVQVVPNTGRSVLDETLAEATALSGKAWSNDDFRYGCWLCGRHGLTREQAEARDWECEHPDCRLGME